MQTFQSLEQNVLRWNVCTSTENWRQSAVRLCTTKSYHIKKLRKKHPPKKHACYDKTQHANFRNKPLISSYRMTLNQQLNCKCTACKMCHVRKVSESPGPVSKYGAYNDHRNHKAYWDAEAGRRGERGYGRWGWGWWGRGRGRG